MLLSGIHPPVNHVSERCQPCLRPVQTAGRDAIELRRGMAPSLLLKTQRMERPMKRNDLSRSLVAFDQNSTLVAVIELSLKSWLIAGLVPGLARRPFKKQSADAEAIVKLL